MENLTALYYTSNVEDGGFEEKIRANILKQKGNLPLISISQKPINFGRNICVGQHFSCYGNEFKQIQIGLQEVETEYVITTEADVLYPPDYFQFRPESGDYWRYGNVWVCYTNREQAYFKLYSDGAQIMRTEFWRDRLEKAIGTKDDWFVEGDILEKLPSLPTDPVYTWTSTNPVITFKTPHGVAKHTSLRKQVEPASSLPYWGDIVELKKELGL